MHNAIIGLSRPPADRPPTQSLWWCIRQTLSQRHDGNDLDPRLKARIPGGRVILLVSHLFLVEK